MCYDRVFEDDLGPEDELIKVCMAKLRLDFPNSKLDLVKVYRGDMGPLYIVSLNGERLLESSDLHFLRVGELVCFPDIRYYMSIFLTLKKLGAK